MIEFAKTISEKYDISINLSHFLCLELAKVWPQINEKTKLFDASLCGPSIRITEKKLTPHVSTEPPLIKLPGLKNSIRRIWGEVKPGKKSIEGYAIPPTSTRNIEIDFKHFGISEGSLLLSAVCVYHAENDTLYIKRIQKRR